MQLAGLPSLFLYLDPQRKASGQPDLPLGDSKRSNEEAFAKPPTPTCLSREGELLSKLLRGWGWGLGEHGRVVIHQDGSEVQRGELLLINYQAGCQALYLYYLD